MMLPTSSQEKPRLHIPVDKLKEAKDWKVGKKYVLELEVEMVGLNQDQYSEDKMICADFVVKKAKPMGEKSELAELRKRYE